MLRLKSGGLRGLAEPAAGVIATVVEPAPADVITWVPPDLWRTIHRGYHPAQMLADGLGRRWGIPARPLLAAALVRRPQRGLDPAARRRNVREAFRAAGVLRGEAVILVDDVLTTGATLSACGSVLRRAGAATVSAVTLARVVRL